MHSSLPLFISMEDSAMASFKKAIEELLFSLEREPYRSVLAAYLLQRTITQTTIRRKTVFFFIQTLP
ncbi:MAG: hypothetical protein ACI8ZO_000535 [Flavobacteriales bacterium]|jgi:hypothetical protein